MGLMRGLSAIALIFLILFTGCQVQKSELTDKEWVISYKVVMDNEQKSDHKAYKKDNREMIFNFYKSGLVLLDKNNQELNGYWVWDRSRDKHRLKITIDGEETIYIVDQLKKDKLKFYVDRTGPNYDYTELTSYTFLTNESDEWRSDSLVNQLNLMK